MKRKITCALMAVTVLLFAVTAAHALENEFLKVSKSSDGKGLTLTSKIGGSAVDVVLVDKKGNVRGGLSESKIKLSAKRNFIEVSPSGDAVEVRMKARFAFIPEFHGYETLFDPTIFKGKNMYVAAENFFVSVLEGGKGGVMFVWPRGGEQIPLLVVEGKDADRRFTKMRVTFGGKPVFIAVMDHAGKMFPYVDGLATRKLSYDTPLSSSRKYRYTQVQTGWKIPFSASWFTMLAKPYPLVVSVPHGKGKYDKIQFAKNTTKVNPPLSGQPVATLLLSTRKSGWNDIKSSFIKLSWNNGGTWVLQLDQRFSPYHAAVTYPKTRTSNTPRNVVTVSDVIYEALGKDEAYAVVDYAGLKWRGVGVPKGEPKVDATCAGWGGLNKYFNGKQKDRFTERLQGCYNFCFYNRKRTDEYLKAAHDIIELCKKESKNPKLKNFAARLTLTSKHAEELFDEENMKFREAVKKSVKTKSKYAGNWHLFFTAEEAEKVNLDDALFKKIKDYHTKSFTDGGRISRSHWTTPGGILDGTLDGERRVACRIRQEAALSAVNSPEERAFALKVRDIAQKALRVFHMKEAWPKGPVHFYSRAR